MNRRVARLEWGFSVVEILVAMVLILFTLLSIVPLFTFAMRSTTSAADAGNVGAVAVQRMERLRQVAFENLDAGGSLTTDEAGYFDNTDPAYTVRWQVVDDATPPTLKTIQVRVIARRDALGARKEVTLTSMAAE